VIFRDGGTAQSESLGIDLQHLKKYDLHQSLFPGLQNGLRGEALETWLRL
jgi:hypothetical protein